MNLSPIQAQTILRFMANVQLNGSDAPVFMECIKILGQIAKGPEASISAPAPIPAENPLPAQNIPNGI